MIMFILLRSLYIAPHSLFASYHIIPLSLMMSLFIRRKLKMKNHIYIGKTLTEVSYLYFIIVAKQIPYRSCMYTMTKCFSDIMAMKSLYARSESPIFYRMKTSNNVLYVLWGIISEHIGSETGIWHTGGTDAQNLLCYDIFMDSNTKIAFHHFWSL